MFYKIEDYLTFFQNVKNNAPTLKKGTVPKVDFSGSPVYIIIAAFGFFAFSFMNGFVIGLFLLLGIFALPFVLVLYFCFFMTLTVLMQMNYYHIRKKDTSFWYLWNYNMYRIVHHRFTVCLMTGCLTPMANYLMRLCEYFKLRKPLLVLKYCNIQYLMSRYPEITPCITQPIEEPGTYISPDDFALLLGASTGLMSDLWHGSSLAAGQNVLLNLNDTSKNILALGGIGSGKTSSIMQPLLLQLLHQGCGGLVFDIKGDVKDTTLSFAKYTNRHIRILGPLQSKFNLLCGITPETASSFLKSSLMLSNGHNLDGFWIETATELSRNVLGLLSFCPKYYTLADLHRYIFDQEACLFLENKLQAIKPTLSPEQKRLFDVYHRYKTSIFESFDEKVKSGVKATLAQTLSPFSHPELHDAFCSQEELRIEEILEGTVFLVDMPLSAWGLSAKVIYTFIKLRFFNLMQKHHNAENRKLPVFFMCDEFQEIISCNKDGLSDLNFWDKSRSSKTIGIISAQSIASILAATPNRDYAYALLQNFRNKICLTTEDPLTIDYISNLTGQAKTLKRSWSHNNSTISEARDSVLEAQVFRSLSPNSALALLTINNLSSDDALKLYPIFLENSSKNENK